MKRLVIVGAGSFGREVLSWAEQIAKVDGRWSIAGFLDDNPNALDGYELAEGVIASISDYQPRADDVFAMGLAKPREKLRVGQQLEARGAEFVSVVHPTVVLARNVRIGHGCVLCPNVVVSCDAVIGHYVGINVAASIGHDAKIADGCTISSHADVMGFARLETGAFLGSHAAVFPKVVVGEDATVGAGSVALSRVERGTTVLGVPAKTVKY